MFFTVAFILSAVLLRKIKKIKTAKIYKGALSGLIPTTIHEIPKSAKTKTKINTLSLLIFPSRMKMAKIKFYLRDATASDWDGSWQSQWSKTTMKKEF